MQFFFGYKALQSSHIMLPRLFFLGPSGPGRLLSRGVAGWQDGVCTFTFKHSLSSICQQSEGFSPFFLFCLFSLLACFLQAHPHPRTLFQGQLLQHLVLCPFAFLFVHFHIFVQINVFYFNINEIIHYILLFVSCFPFKLQCVSEIFWLLFFL